MPLPRTTIGFLRYNFPPASIFLGDSGSMLIGLVIGVLGIALSFSLGMLIGGISGYHGGAVDSVPVEPSVSV